MARYIVAHQYVTWVIDKDDLPILPGDSVEAWFDSIPIVMLTDRLDDGTVGVTRQTRAVFELNPSPSIYDIAQEKHARFFAEEGER